MAHKFAKGFLTGVLAAAGAVAGSVYAFKKTYVDPVEDKAEEINTNRRRAIRKSRGAHQG
ncbi:DUF3042 family protein [Lacticaseibacillus pantheris]|jgi:hypothetical protein|uniref:DUF3042 domain-containing protein n=1 Tax=Lacticaseibacillus pantheris DSM 15945 = JCM 12539 = NBRC 106106 TaxID=1423783 RepID=A0A0R1U1R6_9LACO|nr:DUF3042 family protein [Lacticaseibacillus pantheris]KRL86846.1 hypothetical protein FC50_GL000494 [Lacticaseibacillus pantheris DSM 15945 = JCM 12539 = NBRC 106106]WKF86071.1 DUF3042 family protein [Lacticaseibacillus pantheris]